MCYTGKCPYEKVIQTNSGNHIACETICKKPEDADCPLEINEEEDYKEVNNEKNKN